MPVESAISRQLVKFTNRMEKTRQKKASKGVVLGEHPAAQRQLPERVNAVIDPGGPLEDGDLPALARQMPGRAAASEPCSDNCGGAGPCRDRRQTEPRPWNTHFLLRRRFGCEDAAQHMSFAGESANPLHGKPGVQQSAPNRTGRAVSAYRRSRSGASGNQVEQFPAPHIRIHGGSESIEVPGVDLVPQAFSISEQFLDDVAQEQIELQFFVQVQPVAARDGRRVLLQQPGGGICKFRETGKRAPQIFKPQRMPLEAQIAQTAGASGSEPGIYRHQEIERAAKSGFGDDELSARAVQPLGDSIRLQEHMPAFTERVSGIVISIV